MNPKLRVPPPIWLALLISCLGTYGMSLVYRSLTGGGLGRGLIGVALLSTAVVIVGTPLARERYLRKRIRDQKAARQDNSNIDGRRSLSRAKRSTR